MRNPWIILKTGLLLGSLDLAAACLQFSFKTNAEPSIVLKFIGSGIFGTEAFVGGMSMILAGVILHYLIAICFTILFFRLYPALRHAVKNNILIGMFYGAFIWCVMNLVVLPISNTPPQPFSYSEAAVAMAILIVFMGIPLAFIASEASGKTKPPLV